MDLSTIHEPVTDMFSGTSLPDEESLGHAKGSFLENGFVTGISLLNEAQIEALRNELDRIMEPQQPAIELFYEYNSNEAGDPDKRLFHALGAWRVSEAFHDLIFAPNLVAWAEALLEGQVRLWHDQVFVKPANDGAFVAWHQDYSYWTRTVPMAHLTCWIGLDDADEENGCVHYVPGSHRWHLLPRGELADDMNSVVKHLNAEQMEEFKPVPSVLKAGEASFHHPMMVHGSHENRSDRPRRGAIVNFIRDGVRSNTYEPLLAGIPLIAMGQKLEGQFFPLLSR